MADKKISQLTASTTPLAGTEVLPIVQSGSTVKVAVSDLTAGRAVSASSVTASTGNLTFSGTGQRILGDMSNGTIANRLVFQTTTVNGNTNIHIVPNGTSTTAGFKAETDPTFTSGSVLTMDINGGVSAQISSAIRGAGTYLPLLFATNGTEKMRISTAGDITAAVGNLVIGTTAKGITTGSAIPLGFGVNNSVADMTLDTSGNLVIGSTNLGGRLSVFTGSGVGQFIRVQQISATVMEFRNAQDLGGSITIVAGGATSFNTVSDERLKHNIVDAPDAANLIDALQVRSFKWKVDDTAQRYGFIAQELLEVAPEAVSVPEDNDKMMGVDHSKLVPMLVKEVQSLRARVAQLEGK
jgi:hypothetical protein